MRNRDLRPAAKANPTIQQAFERFQKYNRLKNLSQGSLDFYAAKGRSFFRFLGDTEQPIHTITEETVEDYIFYMKDQQLHDTTINTNLRMVRAFLYWCMEKGYLEKYPIRLVRADDPIAVFGKGAGLAVRFLQQLLQLVGGVGFFDRIIGTHQPDRILFQIAFFHAPPTSCRSC